MIWHRSAWHVELLVRRSDNGTQNVPTLGAKRFMLLLDPYACSTVTWTVHLLIKAGMKC